MTSKEIALISIKDKIAGPNVSVIWFHCMYCRQAFAWLSHVIHTYITCIVSLCKTNRSQRMLVLDVAAYGLVGVTREDR